MKHSICLVCAYFGGWPAYIDLVFHTCARNPTIDWLIFTDCGYLDGVPENVKLIAIDFDGFRQLIQSRFDFPIALERPYKLCDFKPTYGFVLSAEGLLDGYDFWGHCDLDIIFGDLRKFATSDVLDAYDKVFTRGHLTLYRNNSSINEYFMLNCDEYYYKKVLSSPESWDFDEMPGMNKRFRDLSIPQYPSRGLLGDLDPTCRRLVLWAPGVGGSTKDHLVQAFFWEDGHTYQAWWRPGGSVVLNELAYLHLQQRKFDPPDFCVDEELSGFFVTPSGFVRKYGAVRIIDLLSNNDYSIPEWIASSHKRWKDARHYVKTYGTGHRVFTE